MYSLCTYVYIGCDLVVPSVTLSELRCAVLCYATRMLCCAVICYAVLCYDVICYDVLCYVMLCYAMLCFAMLSYA